MHRHLAALVGAALAALLVLYLAGRWVEPAALGPRIEVVPSTPVSPAERPVQPEAAPTRTSLLVEDPTPHIALDRLEDTSPPVPVPAPIAVVDDEHWIQGRAMLVDGTPITGFEVVAIQPPGPDLTERQRQLFAHTAALSGGLATCSLDELGRFRLGPLPGGSYGVALRVTFLTLGEGVAYVEAPTTTAELRVDGQIAVLELPRSALARPGWRGAGARLETTSTAGASSSRGGSAMFDDGGLSEQFVRTGDGYYFKFTAANGGTYTGALGENTPPGRHHVLLEENRHKPGTLRAILCGDAVEDEGTISVSVVPLSPQLRQAGVPRRRLILRTREGVAAAKDLSVDPGRYATNARVIGVASTAWAAVARPTVIDVRPGEVTEVEVELIEGGDLSVLTEGTVAVEPPPLHLESYDDERREWIGLLVRTAEGRQASAPPASTLSPGVANEVTRVFPPGPLRVRLRGDGWRTVEAALTIVSGQTTTWRPRLELE
ncbi:MAG: hypothetical protein AAGB93_03515 [Planctomycetota bacterium]